MYMHVFYSRTLFHVFLLKKCVHLVDDTFSNEFYMVSFLVIAFFIAVFVCFRWVNK